MFPQKILDFGGSDLADCGLDLAEWLERLAAMPKS